MYFLFSAAFLAISAPAFAQTYQTEGDCAPLAAHHADVDVSVTTATGVTINESNLPLNNIAIPLELPLGDYVDTSSINADLSDTRIRPGEINVNLNTGTTSMNGHEIAPQELINPDCAPKKKSVYSTQ